MRRIIRLFLLAVLLLVSALLVGHAQTSGQPTLTGSTAGQGFHSSGAFYVDLRLTNTGGSSAYNIRINQLPLRTLTGTGTVTYHTTLGPSLSNFGRHFKRRDLHDDPLVLFSSLNGCAFFHHREWYGSEFSRYELQFLYLPSSNSADQQGPLCKRWCRPDDHPPFHGIAHRYNF